MDGWMDKPRIDRARLTHSLVSLLFLDTVSPDIPFGVTKSTLVAKIASLVNAKTIEGVSDLRDESDRNSGVRIVVDLKRGVGVEGIVDKLFKHSQLEAR